MLLRDRKARVGATTLFPWLAPAPLESGTTPTLTFRPPSGDVARVLTHVRTDVTVTAVDDARKVLTTSEIVAGWRGLQGDAGAAWLVTENDGPHPVQVVRIGLDGASKRTQVVLAEPLSRPITIEAGDYLQWRLWHATVTAADVAAAAQRDIPWTVEYSAQPGLDLPIRAERQEGLLHVVRQPFSTQLTHDGLLIHRPELASKAPRRQEGWAPQIAVAEQMLIDRLRTDLASRGLYEDDLDGSRLQRAHVLLTTSVILELAAPDQAEAARAAANAAYDQALRSLWVDLDRDGVVDDGEGATQITGGVSPAVRSAASPYTASTLPFTRGMGH